MRIWDLRNCYDEETDTVKTTLEGTINEINIEQPTGWSFYHIHLYLDTGYEVELTDIELKRIQEMVAQDENNS